MKNKTKLRNKTKEYFTKNVKVTDEGVFWTNDKTKFSFVFDEEKELKILASNKEYVYADFTVLDNKDIKLIFELIRIMNEQENPIIDNFDDNLKRAEEVTDEILRGFECFMKEM